MFKEFASGGDQALKELLDCPHASMLDRGMQSCQSLPAA
jgi:hypothetical protein